MALAQQKARRRDADHAGGRPPQHAVCPPRAPFARFLDRRPLKPQAILPMGAEPIKSKQCRIGSLLWRRLRSLSKGDRGNAWHRPQRSVIEDKILFPGSDLMRNDHRIAHGGKAVYGARLGILMLEARFPRIPGDMGHAGTWPFPVLYKVVKGASPERVVAERAVGLLPSFIAAARELEALGADGITTNCGFLSLYQKQLAAAVGVPVATSSLMQVPMIESTLPAGKRVGVITVSAADLTRDHLLAIGLDPGLPVIGTDAGREFTRVLLGNEETLDVAAAEQDILEAGAALLRQDRSVGAILLECTNMAPYARALSERLALPVYDIYSFMLWFHAGLAPRDFGHPGSTARPWRER
jgi:Asp/Glu/hydantoin racemase